MPFSFIDLLFGFLVPAALAAFAPIDLWRPLPESRIRAAVAAAGVVAGFVLGYLLLGLGPWQPGTHWHWLPHVLVLSLLVPVLRAIWGEARVASAIAGVAIILTAALVLVPDWPDLTPSRPIYMVCWAIYTTAVFLLLQPLCRQAEGPLVPFVLAGTLLCAAGLMVPAGSLRFAQMAGCGAGAFAGLTCTAAFDRREHWLAGMALPFSLIASGIVLIGETNSYSEVPRFCYYLIPLAPLTLWAQRLRSVDRLSPGKRTAVLIGLPIVVCTIALVVALVVDLSSGSYG